MGQQSGTRTRGQIIAYDAEGKAWAAGDKQGPARGKKWLLRIFLGRDTQGKRLYDDEIFHGTYPQTSKALTAKLAKRDAGSYPKKTKQTVAQYLDSWLATKPFTSQRTRDDYQGIISDYINPELGYVRLTELRPQHIRELYAKLAARGLTRRVEYCHSVLRAALRQAERDELFEGRNPISAVQAPTVKSLRVQAQAQGRDIDGGPKMRAFTPEEVDQFLEQATGTRFGVLFAFALSTGMRPGEFRAVRWSDLAADYSAVRVQQAVEQTKAGERVKPWLKTAKSRRTIVLPEELRDMLRAHRQHQLEDRMRAGPLWENNDYIFPNERGGLLDEGNLSRRYYKPLCKAAGIVDMGKDGKEKVTARLYDLRHTCATLLIADGEDSKTVADQLGHASVVLTLNTYGHVQPGMKQGASDRLRRIMFGKRQTA